MEFHVGRLFDHVHLRAADLEASRNFYRAAFAALGRTFSSESPGHFSSDELWVSPAEGTPSRVHLAFQTASREEVQRFYQAALAAGGRDNGPPGERKYHPGYSTPTATTSRRCTTARPAARQRRSSSRRPVDGTYFSHAESSFSVCILARRRDRLRPPRLERVRREEPPHPLGDGRR